jgi:branched-chain amino acid transport system substrate-binding protein
MSDDLVRIGVLADQSGIYADFGGSGNVVAARMAVEDDSIMMLPRVAKCLSPDFDQQPSPSLS